MKSSPQAQKMKGVMAKFHHCQVRPSGPRASQASEQADERAEDEAVRESAEHAGLLLPPPGGAWGRRGERIATYHRQPRPRSPPGAEPPPRSAVPGGG